MPCCRASPRNGLASHRTLAQSTRPDKQLYAITRDGRAALEQWLETVEPGARDTFFLKLFVGGLTTPEVLLAHVAQFIDDTEARLAELQAIDADELEPRPRLVPPPHAPVRDRPGRARARVGGRRRARSEARAALIRALIAAVVLAAAGAVARARVVVDRHLPPARERRAGRALASSSRQVARSSRSAPATWAAPTLPATSRGGPRALHAPRRRRLRRPSQRPGARRDGSPGLAARHVPPHARLVARAARARSLPRRRTARPSRSCRRPGCRPGSSSCRPATSTG